jgi:hypothetical protein
MGVDMGFAAEALRREASGRSNRVKGTGGESRSVTPKGTLGEGLVDGDGFATPEFRGEELPSFLGTRSGDKKEE